MEKLDELCVNTIRMLSADCVQKANSGHPGMPMGAAALAYVLWTRCLRHNPSNPGWADRDRFVLSAGHGSALLYSLLHLTGYDLPLDELKKFRQWGSKTPGHPEYHHTPGVETTTGPLGQGLANAVGMAMAERLLSAHFNRPNHNIVNHYTYVLVGDGDLMEGVSHEAASLAGHLALGKLICIYDDNLISIEGSTDLAFTENRLLRFESYGWQVLEVEDGNDLESIEKSILEAQKDQGRPSLISVRTHIGYGSPNKQDSASAHGEPLGEDELRITKENLGWPTEPSFFIPDDALSSFRQAVKKGEELEAKSKKDFNAYKEDFPELATKFEMIMKGELPNNWEQKIPSFPPDKKGMATRVASGRVLNSIAPNVFNLIGGSADLAPSNKTLIDNEDDFQAGSPSGRNIRFGVREHGMGSIMNGMALHGGIIPYGGTFLVFSDYMRPAIRMAAIMGLHVIYVFTHDSIGLGEDGPTHQPVEHIASLRAIPNLIVIRPADANETAVAWRVALQTKDRPVLLALSRQGLPTLDREVFGPEEGLTHGAYVLKDAPDGNPDIILIASGSEVELAIEAALKLEEKSIQARVISMPSWELFDMQPEAYLRKILPKEIKARIAIEAGSSQGWDRYIGDAGLVIGVDHFGASAPYKTIFEKFGITTQDVIEKTLALLDRS